MNEEDKKRFCRYRKGYITSIDDEELILFNKKKQELKESKQKQVLGYINNVNINTDTLIKNITNKN
jgi:hypothetical protein